MKIATQADAQRIDALHLGRTGISEVDLVDAAGAAVADFVTGEMKVSTSTDIAVICGAGKNGADGFSAANHLRKAGFLKVRAYLCRPVSDLKPSAARHLERTRLFTFDISTSVRFGRMRNQIARAGLVIDCMLGTGIRGPLQGLAAEIADFMNSLPGTVVSVDLPSGFYSDSSELPAVCVRPDFTVAIGLPKPSLVLGPSKYSRGSLRILNIGFPTDLLTDPAMTMNYYTGAEAGEDIPHRPPDAYKNCFGHCAIWAGSEGKAGAAGLASLAALRSGAGLVTALCDRSILSVVAGFSPEIMTFEIRAGSPSEEAGPDLSEFLRDKSVILAGPGLGMSDRSREIFRLLMRRYEGPLVLDADALNMLALEPGLAGGFKGQLILTPHPGEMSKLLGEQVGKIDAQTIGKVRAWAGKIGAWVVLKSSDTFVFDPGDGQVWVNSTGNAGLAKAGSGDALAGIIAGVLSQKVGLEKKYGERFNLTRTLSFGTWLHGRAADLAAEKIDQRSLIATDVIAGISDGYRSLSPGL